MTKKPPVRGDIVWIDFTPHAGHEQAGRRPAIVLSASAYNRQGLMVCCPITNKAKGYPFEVQITCKVGKASGVALADHVKNLDWIARDYQKSGEADEETVDKISSLVSSLLAL